MQQSQTAPKGGRGRAPRDRADRCTARRYFASSPSASSPSNMCPRLPPSGCEAGLLRGRHQPLEDAPVHVQGPRALARDCVDRQHDVALVDLAYGDARVAGHGAVHGLLCEGGAIEAVVSIGGHRSDHVRWVDVLDADREVELLEVARDLVLQVGADVGEHLVAAGILLRTIALQDRVSAPLGDNNDGVLLRLHNLDDVVHQLFLGNVHLGNEAGIHDPGGERRVSGDEATMPAHQLHQADAVRIRR
mmetsp:Transcript_105213/g.304365  ORF Transcript_105213/g.304365 Transcript_105213/m.304365 type:complete len:247 (-) Transcript_105213:1169-1909(-)